MAIPKIELISERKHLKILVVEDDRSFRLMLQETLNDLGGFYVDKTFACDGRDALNKFKEVQPDIVLLDIHLPDANGLSLITPMLKIRPTTGIVMVTGSRLSSDVTTAKQHGAIGYVLKPYTRKKIDDALQVFLTYNKRLKDSCNDEQIAAIKNADAYTEFFITDGDIETQLSPIDQTLSRWNILFADGFLTNIETAKRRLHKLCHHLDVATTAEECQRFMDSKAYQCVLIDPDISDGSGYRITQHLKENYQDQAIKPYVLALMPSKDELDKKKWLRAGMNDFLVKPCTFKDIEEKIRKFAQIYIEESNTQYTS